MTGWCQQTIYTPSRASWFQSSTNCRSQLSGCRVDWNKYISPGPSFGLWLPNASQPVDAAIPVPLQSESCLFSTPAYPVSMSWIHWLLSSSTAWTMGMGLAYWFEFWLGQSGPDFLKQLCPLVWILLWLRYLSTPALLKIAYDLILTDSWLEAIQTQPSKVQSDCWSL